ncbi:m7GpppX diphosphatase-like [Littorina saxatilis]|uniref:m7GpppX diphosphatase n=1 Tax=Littorina saxatilis TaxID=31220 RepID=A0AAN9AUZ1_9CAEN
MAATVAGDCGEAKKRKLSGGEPDIPVSPSPSVFRKFRVDKILREDQRNKLITVVGKFGNEAEKDAVVLVERLPLDKTFVEQALAAEDAMTKETLKNDIYSTHSVYTPRAFPDCKATMIYPATAKHIAKYSEHDAFIVRETPHLYQTVTKPCLDVNKFSVQWVHNILEKKTEADRIVFEDPDPETGFILLPDMKWNRTDLDSLYLVAIVHKHGVHSMRHLTAQHLPLLKNVLEKGKKAIKGQFGIPSSKLRIYFHYQPSYSHLHVHFTHVKFDAPGSDCLRAHTLEDVIDNLDLDSDFYSKKTLVYVVRENDELYKAYKAATYFDD